MEVAWLGGSTVLKAGEGGVFPPTGASDSAKTSDDRPAASTASLAEAARSRDEPARLMREADAARVGGRAADAIVLLRRVRDEYPADGHAPLAEFSLGRVLHDLGRSNEAAAAFHEARTMWPMGPLAGDAFAREADELKRGNRLSEAKRVAQAYVERYPKGRHVEAMNKLLAR